MPYLDRVSYERKGFPKKLMRSAERKTQIYVYLTVRSLFICRMSVTSSYVTLSLLHARHLFFM